MTTHKPRAGTAAPTDKDVQALLERHHCPTPLHALRTLLLGNIASPRLEISPFAPLVQAWGGELPKFESDDDLEEVVRVVVQGMWNRLARHQNARDPFRLPRFEVAATRDGLLELGRTRSQEIAGFVDGLFGSDDEMTLPQKASDGIAQLSELHTMFDGAATLLADQTKPATAQELKALLRNLQRLTTIADEQINKVIQSCKRARAHGLEAMSQAPSRRTATAAAATAAATGEVDDIDDDDDEPDVVESPLSGSLTRNGVTVQVDIYAEAGGRWILEIIDAGGNSHVWEDLFDTDEQAMAEAVRALDEAPLEFVGHGGDGSVN
jgi:hypothetical protein